MKRCFMVCFALICFFLVATSNIAQKLEWKGKIEYEDGIKVVKNPGEPLHGRIDWKLEQELSIGNEADDRHVFNFPFYVAVDSQENIFALVAKEFEIRKFDKGGKFLARAGKKGQGPGEFVQPRKLCLDSQDRVLIFDAFNRQLHVFSNDLALIETRKFEFLIFGLGVTEDGNMILQTVFYPQERRAAEIVLTSPSGESIEIAGYPYELPPKVKNQMLSNPYSHELYFAPFQDGGGVYGYSSRYELHVISSLGKPRLKILVDRESEPISEQEKEKLCSEFLEKQKQRSENLGREKLSRADLMKAYVFPEHKPFFTNILVDDKNRIFLRKLKIYDQADSSVTYELFNEEGIYLYDVKIPFSPLAVVNNCLYRVESDRDTGYMVIKRYRITNWD